MAFGAGAEREQAIDLLFGRSRPEAEDGEPFLRAVREAFRRRALETHPDRARMLGRSEASLAAEFRRILDAYELLARPARTEPQRSERREPSPAPRTDPAPRAHRAGSTRARPAPEPRDHVSQSRLPRRPMLFAEFLYYAGRVSWRNLVESVTWQRRQRPPLGRIAVEWGHLTEGEVRAILEHRRRQGADEPFGEHARSLGYLSSAQLLELLARQRRMQRRIGQFFVEAGLLSEEEIPVLEAELARHNARFRRAA